jgi:hypothetical protein
LIVEAITFKLALDFFKFLKKNRINATNIKVDFFDREKHEYIDFVDTAAMETWYTQTYIPLDNCQLGDLCSIVFFLAESNTYNFTTSYKAIDVTDKLNLTTGSQFDLQRNACYAVPGWSEGTWYLKSFREAFTTSRDTSQFPYNNVNIGEFPPTSEEGDYHARL